MFARIYKPARNAMQSGKANVDKWLLEYEPQQRKVVEPLMGYNSTGDMNRQIRLEFDTREEAIAYAERYSIPYRVQNPKEPSVKKHSYSDNFRYGRQQPWTH